MLQLCLFYKDPGFLKISACPSVPPTTGIHMYLFIHFWWMQHTYSKREGCNSASALCKLTCRNHGPPLPDLWIFQKKPEIWKYEKILNFQILAESPSFYKLSAGWTKHIYCPILFESPAEDLWASQVVLVVKNPPANRRRRRFHPWAGKIPWRREWQPTAVLLPKESQGQRSPAGYNP